jgi:hypothetical protein
MQTSKHLNVLAAGIEACRSDAPLWEMIIQTDPRLVNLSMLTPRCATADYYSRHMAKSLYSATSTTLTIVRDGRITQPRGLLLLRVVEGMEGAGTTERGPGSSGDELLLGNLMRQVESRVVCPGRVYAKDSGLGRWDSLVDLPYVVCTRRSLEGMTIMCMSR